VKTKHYCSGCGCELVYYLSVLGRQTNLCFLCREDRKNREDRMVRTVREDTKYEIEVTLKRGEFKRHGLLNSEVVDIVTHHYDTEAAAKGKFNHIVDILLGWV